MFELQSSLILRHQGSLPSMERGRARHVRADRPWTHQRESPSLPFDSVIPRMEAKFEEVEWAQSSSMDHSAPISQKNISWIGGPVLLVRTVRGVAAKPTLVAVFIHASVLLLFWVIVYSTFSCETILDPQLLFLVPWAVVSCVEVLFSTFVGQALYRHLTKGNRRMSAPFLLPLLV